MFYSLPPAGNKIPFSTILRAMKKTSQADHETFLNPIKNYLGTQNLFFLSSGRAALWLILKTLSGLKPERKEVIISAFTCPAVASAVLKAGLRPVLCDINFDDFGFLREELEKKVCKDTLAVVIVHLLGYPANMGETNEICAQNRTFVVEDAAQAFGNSSLNSTEEKLGLLGDAGFYSFGRGKPISIMHGGILVTSSAEIFDKANNIYQRLNQEGSFRNLRYGINVGLYSILSNPLLYWIPQRIPSLHLGETIYEPDFIVSSGVELAEAITGLMIESLEQEKEVRQTNSKWYSVNLHDFKWLEEVPSAEFPYLRYPLVAKDREMREGILNMLMAQGTGAALFYPSPLNELLGLREKLQDETVYTNARRLSDNLITLPVHSGVTDKIRNKIRAIIKEGVHN